MASLCHTSSLDIDVYVHYACNHTHEIPPLRWVAAAENRPVAQPRTRRRSPGLACQASPVRPLRFLAADQHSGPCASTEPSPYLCTAMVVMHAPSRLTACLCVHTLHTSCRAHSRPRVRVRAMCRPYSHPQPPRTRAAADV